VESVDVVVVGGGIQGLVVLRELTAAGYGCVLVTAGSLGHGQTLHSHGLLNSGTGLLTGALHDELHRFTLPYLRRLDVPYYGDDRSYLLLPDPALERLASAWEENSYRPEPVDSSALPRGFEPVAPAYRVAGYNVDKRRLVEALSAGLEHLVLRGEVVGGDDTLEVRKTGSGEIVSLRADAVVVAAGCGAKRLLRDHFRAGEPVLGRIAYTRLHMVCLRGASDVLTDVGAVISSEVMVVGHPLTDGGGAKGQGVKWYVTPVDPAPRMYDEAPGAAAAPVDQAAVQSALEALVRLYPPLADTGAPVEVTVFAGYKQNLDGLPTRRACELVDGDRNVVLVLPSVFANAVPNAADALAILRERLEPTGRAATEPSHGARVGELDEDEGRARWVRWGDFARSFGAIG
jgi:glycine/D-amino acid oxidase-like deaminating enzyme